MDLELSGRVALVTGASRGIGKAIALGLAVSVAAVSPAAATEANAPPIAAQSWASVGGSVDAFSGAFATGVSIGIPAFRGLEPRLSLVYNSSGRNGWLGVGWSLSGFSVIERRGGVRRGPPRYDATDVYVLDGQRLVPWETAVAIVRIWLATPFEGGRHQRRIALLDETQDV